MRQFFFDSQAFNLPVALLLAFFLWSLVWKGIALWTSAQNQQKAWFIIIFVFNTLGLLEIIYLLFFKTKGSIKNKK